MCADVVAEPHSVARCLPQCASDARLPEKLIDGVNVTDDPRHFWLAPIFSDTVRLLLLSFSLSHTHTHTHSFSASSLCQIDELLSDWLDGIECHTPGWLEADKQVVAVAPTCGSLLHSSLYEPRITLRTCRSIASRSCSTTAWECPPSDSGTTAKLRSAASRTLRWADLFLGSAHARPRIRVHSSTCLRQKWFKFTYCTSVTCI